MKFIPTKKQWLTWSLPSKLTAIGVLIGLITLGAYSLEKTFDWYKSRVTRSESEHANDAASVHRMVDDLRTRIKRARIQLKRFEERRAVWSTIDGVKGAFPEFDNRDFLSVAVELQSLRPDDPARKELIAVWQEIVMAEPDVKKAELLFDRASYLLDEVEGLTDY